MKARKIIFRNSDYKYLYLPKNVVWRIKSGSNIMDLSINNFSEWKRYDDKYTYEEMI